MRTERGAGEELAEVAEVEASLLVAARLPLTLCDEEGVPARLAATAPESVLRFLEAGSFLTVLAVPFFPALFGGGLFLGIVLVVGISVDGTGTEDSRRGE